MFQSKKTNNSISSILGPEIKIEGNINAKGDLLIYGEVMGDVNSEGTINSSKGSLVQGNLTAENASIRAVDALNWREGGEVSQDDVLELAIEYAKGEIDATILTGEARKGGSIKEITEGAKKKISTNVPVALDTNMKNKLDMISKHNGEKPEARATGYVVQGINKDMKEFDD